MPLLPQLNQASTRWYSFGAVVATAKNYYTGGINAAKRMMRGIGF